MRVVIVTGLSGSGKTAAIHALEDIGFFCVDNLPVLLLPGLIDLLMSAGDRFGRVGVVMDIREGVFLGEYPRVLEEVRGRGVELEVLFLETSTEVLLRRFEVTRRPHPLGAESTLPEGIERERAKLEGLRRCADRVLDTTCLNVHQLRHTIEGLYGGVGERSRPQVELVSFSYAKGIPAHADILMDARFLPNPFYHPDLKDRDGNDEDVIGFIERDQKASEVLETFYRLVESLVGLSTYEDRAYIVVAVGCTGGRHRSVAVVNRLKSRLEALSLRPKVTHRDLEPLPQ